MATNTVHEVAGQRGSPTVGDTRARCKTQEGVYSIICVVDSSRNSKSSVSKGFQSSQALNAPVRLSRLQLDELGDVDNLAHKLFCINYGCDIYIFKTNASSKPPELLKLIGSKTFEKIYPTSHDFRPFPNKLKTHSLMSHKQKKCPDNYEILIGMNNGQIYLSDQCDVKKIFNMDHQTERSGVTCLKWVPNNSNHFVVGYQSGFLYTFDVEKSSTFPNIHQEFMEKTHLPVGKGILYQMFKESKGLCIYTIKSAIKSLNVHQHVNPVYKWCFDGNVPVNDMAFSPCQKYLSVACQDGFLRVVDYENLEIKTAIRSYFGGLRCVSWSMDSHYLATGGDDDLITIFSVRDNSVLCRCAGHKSRINAVAFDSFVISGSSDVSQTDGLDDCLHSKEIKNYEKFYGSLDSNKKGNKSESQIRSSNSSCIDISKHKTITGSMLNVRQGKYISGLYRLISIADDTFMCFWDLNLKELCLTKERIDDKGLNNVQSEIPIDAPDSKCSELSCNGMINRHFFPLLFGKTASKKLGTKSQASNKQLLSRSAASCEGKSMIKHDSKAPAQKFASLSIFDQRKRDKETKRSSSADPSLRFATITGSEFHSKSNLAFHINAPSSVFSRPCDSISIPLGSRLCPRLLEVPLLDPLVCKKVSHERLVSLTLDTEHIVMSSQDGSLFMWSRPVFAAKL